MFMAESSARRATILYNHTPNAFKSMNEGYYSLVDHVKAYGEKFTPRGHECVEIRPASFSIMDASEGLYGGVSRRLNYRFFAVEALQYIAGWGREPRHAQLLIASNKKMAAFLNPETGTFDGAYGPRLQMSLEAVVDSLRRDPDSRQAYASIWEPGLLNTFRRSLDTPCTLGLHYFVNHGKLCCSTTMRSNDLNWGTPYDVAAFCAVQCIVAGCLGLPPGAYHHFAGSLHLYTKTPPTVAHPRDEAWAMAIGVPRFLAEQPPLDAAALMVSARQLLDRLAYHIIDLGQDWADFNHSLAFEGSCAGYWKQWLQLIRHKWPYSRAASGLHG